MLVPRRGPRMMLQNPPRPLGAGGAGRWRGASHLGRRRGHLEAPYLEELRLTVTLLRLLLLLLSRFSRV